MEAVNTHGFMTFWTWLDLTSSSPTENTIIAPSANMSQSFKCLKGVLNLPWGSANEGDPQILLIKKYLDKLGGNANAGERSDLSTACYEVLQDPEHDELKQQTVNTILWQDKQMLLVKGTLEYLKKEGHLAKCLSPKAANRTLRRSGGDDNSRPVMVKIRLRFLDISHVQNLLHTSGRDMLSILYQDAFNWLLGNVLWYSLHYPTHFSLEETAHVIEDFLGKSTISKDASTTIALDAG